jgi:transcription-repair coupling factor (superfamily II helicase)
MENVVDVLTTIEQSSVFAKLIKSLTQKNIAHFLGLKASATQYYLAALQKNNPQLHLVILSNLEEATYFYNDIQNIIGDTKALLFPSGARFPYAPLEDVQNANLIQRAEVLTFIQKNKNKIVVTYPEALAEKVVSNQTLEQNTFSITRGESCSMDFLIDILFTYNFERVQFVTEPGQFAVRGGLIDVWSFSNDFPSRIDFFGDEVDAIKVFDPADQISIKTLNQLTLTPDVKNKFLNEQHIHLLDFIQSDAYVWVRDFSATLEGIDRYFVKAEEAYAKIQNNSVQSSPHYLYAQSQEILQSLQRKKIIEFGSSFYFKAEEIIEWNITPQTSFNKNFEFLIQNLIDYQKRNYTIHLLSDKPKQLDRIQEILHDFTVKGDNIGKDIEFIANHLTIHEGFVDNDLKMVVYTDHQIFDRYHRYRVKDSYKKSKQALTIQEITGLQKGDFVTHIDHGIGVFDGLEMMDVGGKLQEAVRLIYKGNDVLYVSIQSLHRIAKYSGKEGKVPVLNKLGTNVWKNKKAATKKKVKELAFDLIQLYAKRKANEGFAFSSEHPYQNEMEASFIFEDTPDQEKSTAAVKKDMENPFPMDRLVCGDVGFGKTEIAIRAAFKAALDNKQTAVLVPTTILAFQHYRTFSERLKNFPVTVDYISRFRSAKEIKNTLQRLAEGKVDIIIGTHRLVGKDIVYKDLGLLIIDEEQKFGVSVKDKLKTLKENLDTLTLTATPIPRTLQFSLLGARDLSVINTPPPNRYPVETIVTTFNQETIRDAVVYELSRGGQVYVIHNRVQNIHEVAGMIQALVPMAKIGVGHGQMDGKKLEDTMMAFVEGDFDVLVATTIIESGLDIPNANTIIINNANNFGLSDLHQMRGRVGRSNKKAFCYLLSPPLSTLTDDARKRLRALEEFSDLGSGFNIAMRDLDIRGAGDLLGGEQSGFISDLGYETYQKILNEAIEELKENEFKDLYEEELKDENRTFVKDCVIDTDLEVLIPTTYVNAVDERLKLYKRLNDVQNEEELQTFKAELIDRFGVLPNQVEELLDTMRLKWVALRIGLERIVLKNNLLRVYFISDAQHSYYQSTKFSKVLQFVQHNSHLCKMKEEKEKLTLSFPKINTIHTAIEILQKIENQ